MLLTNSALRQKEKELERLNERLNEIRKEKHLSFSQADGDGWHDNFGYEQAVRDETMIINEINALIESIRTATILECESVDNHQISVDSNVTLRLDYGDGDVEEIVGVLVALKNNSSTNEITLNSPIGQAIFGKKKDEVCECLLPNGNKVIIEIMCVS